jgi:hypothetical protein
LFQLMKSVAVLMCVISFVAVSRWNQRSSWAIESTTSCWTCLILNSHSERGSESLQDWLDSAFHKIEYESLKSKTLNEFQDRFRVTKRTFILLFEL